MKIKEIRYSIYVKMLDWRADNSLRILLVILYVALQMCDESDDKVAALEVDNGSGMCKAGFTSDDCGTTQASGTYE